MDVIHMQINKLPCWISQYGQAFVFFIVIMLGLVCKKSMKVIAIIVYPHDLLLRHMLPLNVDVPLYPSPLMGIERNKKQRR